jgi:hypothetical protein
MRASIYNNPLFADGLAGIIENYMGNPDRERAIARDELDMQRGQLDLENQRCSRTTRSVSGWRWRAVAVAGGGSGGVDPARLGALFAQLGQPQGASPYSTGTPVTGDFIAPSQPLSFGEALARWQAASIDRLRGRGSGSLSLLASVLCLRLPVCLRPPHRQCRACLPPRRQRPPPKCRFQAHSRLVSRTARAPLALKVRRAAS